MKLFNEQSKVLQSMMIQWKGIMTQLNRKLTSEDRLAETSNKIASYISETETMIANCQTAQDAVSLINMIESS